MDIGTNRPAQIQDTGAPQLRSVADLTERIGNLFASPSYQPPYLPSVAIELLDVARYPDIDLKRIGKLIAKDPMLAGHVMRRVQSPFYAGRVPITDLNQAIFRLGLLNIRDIVLEAALNMRVFSSQGYVGAMERIRRHSVATAHIAKILAQTTGDDPHAMFLLGLLHDIGLAAGLITVEQMFQGQQRPPISQIWPAVDTIHESSGILLARMWDLPGDFPMAIGGHHHFLTGGTKNTSVAILHISEAIATRLGKGVTPPGHPDYLRSVDVIDAEVVAAARSSLGLSQSDLMKVIRASEERLDAI
jgi:HD-like signal output (HDOD) protein